MFVTQKQLAECLGVSLRRVQQLQTQGVIHRDPEQNEYDLAECNRAYIKRKVKSEVDRQKAETKEEVQAQHERIKMQISKEKLRRIRRETLDVEDVQWFLTDQLTRFRSAILALPAKIVMSVSGEDTNQAIEAVTRMLENALEELSEYDPEAIDQEAGMEIYDDDEDDDEDEE